MECQTADLRKDTMNSIISILNIAYWRINDRINKSEILFSNVEDLGQIFYDYNKIMSAITEMTWCALGENLITSKESEIIKEQQLKTKKLLSNIASQIIVVLRYKERLKGNEKAELWDLGVLMRYAQKGKLEDFYQVDTLVKIATNGKIKGWNEYIESKSKQQSTYGKRISEKMKQLEKEEYENFETINMKPIINELVSVIIRKLKILVPNATFKTGKDGKTYGEVPKETVNVIGDNAHTDNKKEMQKEM